MNTDIPCTVTLRPDHDQENGTLITSDGLSLFWQSWIPEDPSIGHSGAIVIVHGLAEYSGRYAATARHLATHGWVVYAADLRSHGYSQDGKRPGRVHVDDFSDYARDVDAVMALVRQHHPGLPRVLLGHSMGGLIALRYAIDNPDSLCGAVISSPALGTHPDFQPPKILQWLVGMLSLLIPRLRVKSNLDTHAVSRDPAVVNAYETDQMISQKVSVRFYSAMMEAISEIRGKAPDLKTPTLLMQSGDDRLVDPQATARWAETAEGNVELVIWEGLYHEMFNEPEKDEVLSRMVTWLKQFTVD